MKNQNIKTQTFSNDIYSISKKNVIMMISAIFMVLIILIIIGSFFDLQISKALASWALPQDKIANIDYDGNLTNLINSLGKIYTNDVFSNIIDTVGFIPPFLLLVFALGVFYWNTNRINNNKLKITLKIIFIILMIAAGYYLANEFCKALVFCVWGQKTGTEYLHKGKISIICVSVVVGIGLAVGSIFTSCLFDKATKALLLKWSFIYICSIIVAAIFAIVLKQLVVRERFRLLFAMENVDTITIKDSLYDSLMSGIDFNNENFGGYVPWFNSMFKAHNSIDNCKSFPSGHACFTMSFVGGIIVLPFTLNSLNTKKGKLICFITPSIYLVLVAIGRIMAGAHYLTDVLFGILFALIPLIFFSIFFISKKTSPKFLNNWTNINTLK